MQEAEALLDEPMGTKDKFWRVGPSNKRQLFKYARINNDVTTGEDWSEKIVSEIAVVLGVPAAKVELAVCEGRRGTLSFDFTRNIEYNGELCTGNLYHGNQLIPVIVDSAYPSTSNFRTSNHTIDAVDGVI